MHCMIKMLSYSKSICLISIISIQYFLCGRNSPITLPDLLFQILFMSIPISAHNQCGPRAKQKCSNDSDS